MKTYDCPHDGVEKPDRRKVDRHRPDSLEETSLFNGFTDLIFNLEDDRYLQGYAQAMLEAFATYTRSK